MLKLKTQSETEKGLENVTEFAKALVRLLLNGGDFGKAQMVLERSGIDVPEAAFLLDALGMELVALEREELQLLLQNYGYGKKQLKLLTNRMKKRLFSKVGRGLHGN